MKKTLLACLLVSSTRALAGGQEDSLGVGAEFMMNGLTGGASLNYDMGKMHFGGFLGFYDGGDNDESDYTFGGRFYYHLHSTAMSDFGIGGSLGFLSDENGMGDRASFMFLEPSVQIRAFIAANVAISVNLGVIIALQDADGFAITGGIVDANTDEVSTGLVTGGAGLHYYFF